MIRFLQAEAINFHQQSVRYTDLGLEDKSVEMWNKYKQKQDKIRMFITGGMEQRRQIKKEVEDVWNI